MKTCRTSGLPIASALIALTLFVFSCGKEEANTLNHMPEAVFTVEPARGDVNTGFVFDASAVSDQEDYNASLEIRWDWTGNGTWDTEFTTDRTANRNYSEPGLYFPLMQVRDSKGLCDSARMMLVVVNDLNNQPPDMPIYLSPPNWQNWMEPTVIFSWSCIDHDNDSIFFDLWTGFSPETLEPTLTGISDYTVEYGQKVYETTISGFQLKKDYFWQVYARDEAGNYTPGHIWRFTTRPE